MRRFAVMKIAMGNLVMAAEIPSLFSETSSVSIWQICDIWALGGFLHCTGIVQVYLSGSKDDKHNHQAHTLVDIFHGRYLLQLEQLKARINVT